MAQPKWYKLQLTHGWEWMLMKQIVQYCAAIQNATLILALCDGLSNWCNSAILTGLLMESCSAMGKDFQVGAWKRSSGTTAVMWQTLIFTSQGTYQGTDWKQLEWSNLRESVVWVWRKRGTFWTEARTAFVEEMVWKKTSCQAGCCGYEAMIGWNPRILFCHFSECNRNSRGQISVRAELSTCSI